jgi:hypothetical protein
MCIPHVVCKPFYYLQTVIQRNAPQLGGTKAGHLVDAADATVVAQGLESVSSYIVKSSNQHAGWV